MMERNLHYANKMPMFTTESLEIILKQMKNSICKINNDKFEGTGFLCNINYHDCETPRVLITSYNVLPEYEVKHGKEINISINNGEINKKILIDEKRTIYINREEGISIIEIKDNDGFESDSFLKTDYFYTEEDYKNLPIYLLHYPTKNEIKKSIGFIREKKSNNFISNNNFIHSCKCDSLSQGGPLVEFENNRVIGIHLLNLSWNFENNENEGVFIKDVINKFIENKNNIFGKEINFNINSMNDMDVKTIKTIDMDVKTIKTIEIDPLTGLKLIIKASDNITISDLYKKYFQTIGIDESFTGNRILFFMNGTQLDHNSNSKIKNFPNSSKILLLDQDNIIPELVSITFEATSDSKKTIIVPFNFTIKALIEKYLKEIEIEENGNKEELIFIFKGKRLNPNSEETVDERFKLNNILIEVFDKDNIIKDNNMLDFIIEKVECV